MPISQELLDELKTIIKEDYGEELEQSSLAEVANTLLGLGELMVKVCPIESKEQN